MITELSSILEVVKEIKPELQKSVVEVFLKLLPYKTLDQIEFRDIAMCCTGEVRKTCNWILFQLRTKEVLPRPTKQQRRKIRSLQDKLGIPHKDPETYTEADKMIRELYKQWREKKKEQPQQPQQPLSEEQYQELTKRLFGR